MTRGNSTSGSPQTDNDTNLFQNGGVNKLGGDEVTGLIGPTTSGRDYGEALQ